MSSTFYEHDIKQQIGNMWERFEAIKRYPRPELSDEQIERERIQAEHNAFAERCPLFASARATAAHRLVVPLEPNGVKPLVPIKDASNDPARLFQWWLDEPQSNVGVVVGRAGNLIALEVADNPAWARLMEMGKVQHPAHDDGLDSVASYVEFQPLDAAWVRLQRQGPYGRVLEFQGWGKEPVRRKEQWYESLKHPERYWLVWAYQSALHLDAFDYRRRKVAAGLTVIGEGEVLPWSGIIDDTVIVAPDGALPTVPTWLAPKLGQPRSRKVMAAVQAQREADLRAMNAGHYAREALLRQLEDEERAKALADRAKADKALAAAMAKDEASEA
jgi:hypothetical protein